MYLPTAAILDFDTMANFQNNSCEQYIRSMELVYTSAPHYAPASVRLHDKGNNTYILWASLSADVMHIANQICHNLSC